MREKTDSDLNHDETEDARKELWDYGEKQQRKVIKSWGEKAHREGDI